MSQLPPMSKLPPAVPENGQSFQSNGSGASADEKEEAKVGDSVYIIGQGPALVVEVKPRDKARGSRGRKKLKVKYPDGSYYLVAPEMVLASETPQPPAEPSRGSQCLSSTRKPKSPEIEPSSPPRGPQRLEYLGRAFDDAGRNIATPSATFALVATMVGGGVLSLPYAMSQCGIALGTLALLTSAFLSTWTLDMLVDCARRTGLDTFELIGHAAFGEYSRKITVFLVFVLTWLALVAYSVLLPDLFVPVVELLAPSIIDSFSNEVVHRFTLLAATCLVAPMCFASGLSALRFLTFASVGSVLFVGIVIATRAWESFGELHDISIMLPSRDTIVTTVGSNYDLWPRDWFQALYVFPMFGVSFMCHFNALPTHQELQRPTRWRMRRVLVLTVSLTSILYLFIGISGYIFAELGTCGNILLNFPRADPMVVFARAALGCVIMLNFPLICQPCRGALYRILVSLVPGLSAAPPVTQSPSQIEPEFELHGIDANDDIIGDGNLQGVAEAIEVSRTRGRTDSWEGASGKVSPLLPGRSNSPPASPPLRPCSPPSSPVISRQSSAARVHVYLRDHMDASRGQHMECQAIDSFCPKDETVQQSAVEPSRCERYVLTAAILGCSFLLACFLKSVLVVWSILGSSVCFIIGFILPAVFWRRIIGPQTSAFYRRASELLAFVSVLLAIVCTVQSATKMDMPPCPALPTQT